MKTLINEIDFVLVINYYEIHHTFKVIYTCTMYMQQCCHALYIIYLYII